MDQPSVNTRNEALEFARRTRRNLEFIEEAAGRQFDVHVVTQLTLSLLGLVVFPKEKLLLDETKRKTITTMTSEGWPTWTITRDDGKKQTKTLADILKHVRNAVAHGRLTFTSDSRRMEEVTIIVEDKNWAAQLKAQELRTFCLKFLDFIDDTIG